MWEQWLLRDSPLQEVERLRHLFENWLSGLEQVTGAGAAEFPPVQIWGDEHGLILIAELPGVLPADLDVTVHQNTLTIRGTRKAPEEEVTRWLRRERAYGDFQRTIALPFPVDGSKVKASFESGVLTLEMPRPESDRPRRIAISS